MIITAAIVATACFAVIRLNRHNQWQNTRESANKTLQRTREKTEQWFARVNTMLASERTETIGERMHQMAQEGTEIGRQLGQALKKAHQCRIVATDECTRIFKAAAKLNQMSMLLHDQKLIRRPATATIATLTTANAI